MKLKRQKIILFFLIGCTFFVCSFYDTAAQDNALIRKYTETQADTSLSGKMNAISSDQLLKGRLSGVRVAETDGNPIGAITITIRGVNSMRGNSDPLWIVDGVILNPSQLEVEQMFWQEDYQKKDYTSIQNTLATINPVDIESIEVLKDVAATAIYGTKGGNGVIIIRTKQAKQQEMTISWSSNVSLVTSVNGDEMLNLNDYKNFQQQLGNNVNGLSNPVNWTEEALKGSTSFSHNHNLSVSGTENKMHYNISGFYRQIEGVVARNNSALGGFRVNIDMNVNDFFSFGTRIAFSYAGIEMTKGANPLGQLSSISAIKNAIPDLNAFNTFASWQSDYDDNSTEYRIMPSVYFDLNPIKGLKFSTNFGTDYRGKDRSSWLGLGIPLGFENNGAASLSSLSAFSFNVNSVLSYNRKFNGNNLSVSVGADFLSRDNSFNTMNGTDFFSHELRAKGINLASSKAKIHKLYVKNEQAGFFGTFSYNYMEKYGLSGILRLDKTIDQEASFTTYPAISGWWNVKDGNSPGNADLISSLVFRAGWGKAGSSLVAPYEFLGKYYLGFDGYVKPENAVFYKMFMKTISNEFNVSINTGFLKERLFFSATYYNKNTDDQIVLNNFGEEFGDNGFWRYANRSTYLDKLSRFSNKGIDLDLQAKIIKNENLNWNLSINGAFNRNKVEKVESGYIAGMPIGAGIISNANRIGSPIGALWGYKEAGIVTSQNLSSVPTYNGKALKTGDILYLDLNGDKDVNNSDKAVIGNPSPRFFGGIISELSYKRLSLDIHIEGAYGHDILNLDRMMQENVSGKGNITPEAFTNAYNGTNVSGYPSIKAAGMGEISNRYVEKGDYTRLAQVKAEYNVPMQKTEWIKSLRFNFNIYNALSFYQGKRWNPEINSYGFDNSRLGITYGAYPETRSFTLGVNATF